MIRKTVLAFGVASAMSLGLFGAASAGVTYYSATDPTDPVTINYYSSGYTDTGSDITFTGSQSSTDTAPSISELRDYYAGVDSDPLWPDASVVFGADFLTQIDVPSTGNYVFQFGADDGGYLLIDGTVVANQGGTHAVNIQPYDVNLTAGIHSLEVQYDNTECCGAVAYVGLNGQTAPVPEPASWAMLLVGFFGLGAVVRGARRDRATIATA